MKESQKRYYKKITRKVVDFYISEKELINFINNNIDNFQYFVKNKIYEEMKKKGK